MATWLDPLDPAIRSAVVSGVYGKTPHTPHGNPVPTSPAVDTISDALARASDILNRLTGYFFHPALQVEEDFTATPRATRLVPSLSPVRAVLSVTRMAIGQDPQVVPDDTWADFGGSIYFSRGARSSDLETWLWGWCGCAAQGKERLRVLYNAGSTITASARQAALALAHEYWLATSRCDDCDGCSLPERTTSVVREGLSYTVADADDPLNSGHTGILAVDAWVRMVNPHRAMTRSGVYTPDSPPPVMRSVKTARPIFPVPTP